ncbi:MAG TPA: hypothetical protein VG125_09885 [Pirellulales bacterium]|jgi:hypothetical protein|nr:hypothetical protein [Pirellulales bacterium]
MSRRFQFNLRTLLLGTALIAVIVWAMKLTGPVILFGILVCYGTPVWLFLALHAIRCFNASRYDTD